MRKPKIMLTALGVCAIVGGALALKATSFSNAAICTTAVQNAACRVTSVPERTGRLINTPTFYYTPKPVGIPCNQVTCPQPADAMLF